MVSWLDMLVLAQRLENDLPSNRRRFGSPGLDLAAGGCCTFWPGGFAMAGLLLGGDGAVEEGSAMEQTAAYSTGSGWSFWLTLPGSTP